MPGAEHLRDSKELTEILKKQHDDAKAVGAICAAPAVVLETHGILKGHTATSHPAFTSKLSDQSQIDTRVVKDGTVITSRGPGTAFEFALALVKMLCGEEKMREVAGPMVMYDSWEKSV